MRLPLVRFTVRRMMIVVAVVAIMIMLVRGWGYRRLAIRYGQIASICKVTKEHYVSLKHDDGGHAAASLAFYEKLRAKYAYASVHPWLPVEPDPPAPYGLWGLPDSPMPPPI